MNTAAICDNVCTVVSRESMGNDRWTPGLLEDRPQQRFADVLPLAEAALERPAHEATGSKAPAKGESRGTEDRDDAARTDSSAEGTEAVYTSDPASTETQDLVSLSGGHLADPLPPAVSGGTRVAAQAKGKGPITEMADQAGRTDAKGHRASGQGGVSSPETGGTGTPENARATHRSFDPSIAPSVESPLAGAAAGSTVLKTGEAAAFVAGKKGGLQAGLESSAQVAGTGSQGATGGPAVVKNAAGQNSHDAKLGSPIPQPGEANAQASAEPRAGAQPGFAADKTAQVSSHSTATTGAARTQDGASGSPSQPVLAQVEHAGEHVTKSSRVDSFVSQDSAGKEGTGSQTRNTASGATPSQLPQEPGSGVLRSKESISATGENPKNSLRTQNAARGNSGTDPVEPGGKEVHGAASKESGSVPSNPSVLSGVESVNSTPRVAGQTQNSMGLDTPVVRTPAQSVGEQILDSMHAAVGRGDRQVLVRLNPPELGTVVVRFQEQGEQVSAMLEVGSREVQREIEQALPQVVRSLQEAGVQVRRLEVVASDQPERDPSREQLPPDTWSQQQQQQGSGQTREHLHASPQTRWSQGMADHGAGREGTAGDESRGTVPRGRIDMLL